MFEMPSKLEFSYSDYEYLLGEGRQLINTRSIQQVDIDENEDMIMEDFPIN